MSEKETKEMIVAYETTIEDCRIQLSSMPWYAMRESDQIVEIMENAQEKVDELYTALRVPKEKQGFD
jgi:hypothetical protein